MRAEILVSATGLLEELGDANAVTLRAVARRAGISAPSIYAHFAGRQAILLAIVQSAFAELEAYLVSAAASAPPDPVFRLRAVAAGYMEFARLRPQRYRLMFGGVWNATDPGEEPAVPQQDVRELGQQAMAVLATALQDCISAGRSTSTDATADAVALWLGLHGLADQRVAAPAFPWPPLIEDRVIASLARLVDS